MIVTTERRYIYKGRAYKRERDAYRAAAKERILDSMVAVKVQDIGPVDTGPFDPTAFYERTEQIAKELMDQDREERKKARDSAV